MTHINIEELNDYTIMHLAGDYNDEDGNDKLLNTFRKLTKSGKDKIIVDLQDVYYMNSRALGVLLSGNALVNKIEGKMVVCNANEYLQNIFDITKLNLSLNIQKDLLDAVPELDKE